MADGELWLDPLHETHRDALGAACARDTSIWQIYSVSYGPEQFAQNFNALLSRQGWRPFAMFERDELVGMSAYIAIDEGRGVLEIGNTYIVSEKRGTGFNRMVKQLMIDRAFSCGFSRIKFRVDARDRHSGVEGKSVSVRGDHGGR